MNRGKINQLKRVSLDDRIRQCRYRFMPFLESEKRTHEHLYRGLEDPYWTLFDMQMDHSLRDEFHQLLALRPARERKNEALFLIKLIGFPSLLEAGKHDKSIQNRAGDYAAHLNFALAANVLPAEFVAFTREGGLRRLPPRPERRSGSPKAKVGGTSSARARIPLFPGGIWLNSFEVGQKLMEARAAAKSEAKEIVVRLQAFADYIVVVDAWTQPWRPPTPFPRLQIIDSSATTPRRRPTSPT